MKNLVNLNDFLIGPFYIDLSDECRISLINKSLNKVGSKDNLSNKLNCSKKSLNEIIVGQTKYGRRFIPANILKNLLSILSLDALDIETHVLHLRRGRSAREVAVKLPLNSSPELSLLVAKALGDGCICSDWRFDYKNNSMELLDEVIMAVEKAIGKSKFTLNNRGNNCYDLKFSPVIGYVSNKLGVPQSYKINQPAEIPEWIKNGDLNCKKSFIRGLFDDESCVDYKGKRIIIAFSKIKDLEDSLRDFLISIKNMLLDFGIETSKISLQKDYCGKRLLRFQIYGQDNFRKFQESIGYTHVNKIKFLEKLRNSYINIHKNKDAVFKSIIASSNPITAREAAENNNISVKLAKFHLSNLVLEGKINKSKGMSPNIWGAIGTKVLNNRENILELLSKKELTANSISRELLLNEKYVFYLLNYLEHNGLISSNCLHPRIWKVK